MTNRDYRYASSALAEFCDLFVDYANDQEPTFTSVAFLDALQ